MIGLGVRGLGFGAAARSLTSSVRAIAPLAVGLLGLGLIAKAFDPK